MNGNERRLDMLAKNRFDEVKDFNLSTLIFHMHDHIVKNVFPLGALIFLSAPSYEYSNYFIKKFI